MTILGVLGEVRCTQENSNAANENALSIGAGSKDFQ